MVLTYIKLAWRNIFRNKRRTLITGIAIGLGLASLIFIDALIIGMKVNMVHAATASFLGEGQIHNRQFRETHEVELTISNHEQVINNLRQDSIIEHFTERVMSIGMITSPANVNSVTMFGINPATEPYMSQIDEAIVEGGYFESDDQQNIIIGSKLAELLEVGLGDRVVLTVAQAHSGDLSQELFRISGMYQFNIKEMDRGMAFVRLPKAQEMLGLESEIHEIALKFTKPEYGQDTNLPFWDMYSNNINEAIPWTRLMPQLDAALRFADFSIFLIGVILFGVVSLGIINTLFMSLHERMFEFGVLRAVGTRPLAMGQLVVFEAGALAIISIILGSIIGFVVTSIIAGTGIDYTGIEYAGITFKELLYPVLEVRQFIVFPIAVFILTLLVGLYPAVYAARISPAEAMRKAA
jgi:putative ABC transport system permease protein